MAMRRLWTGLGLLTAALLAATGCEGERQYLKPPKQPEIYAVPPPDNAMFVGPIKYPQGTLNQDTIHKDSTVDTPAAFGAGQGGRAGGGGMGAGGSGRSY
jgi:hypothetical protein